MFSAAPISELVVFGASDSDAGNVYVATGNTFPAPPYLNGRFTNGANWVDHLADELGLERATPSILGGDNFAVGGATTGDGFSGFAPNVGVQINGSEIAEIDINGDGVPDVRIEGYLENHTPDGDELFVIQAGANDIRQNPFGDTAVSVENLVSHIRDLATAGGEHFLVRNVGRLGDEPVLRILPDLAPHADVLQDVLNGQAAAFNGQLASALNALESELDITISQFDAFAASTPTVLASFGFTNLTDPLCLECGLGIPNASANIVPNPEEYVFWDLVHPTTEVAEVFGKLATTTVTGRVIVNSTEDSSADTLNLNDDVVTLREAVQIANLLDGQQKIEFDLGADEQLITLGGTELLIWFPGIRFTTCSKP
jgi:phospholipase/lecithinase/hemolysin